MHALYDYEFDVRLKKAHPTSSIASNALYTTDLWSYSLEILPATHLFEIRENDIH